MPADTKRVVSPLLGDHKLKLGIFATNCSFGHVATQAPSSYELTWPHTLDIARRADALGLEMIVPIARWRGFGGPTDFNGASFETFTWASALAASTTRATVFATCHVPIIHPVLAAKQSATVDHVAGGRFGLNVVMGWSDREMGMFGLDVKEHSDRYGYGAEWLEIVRRLWTEEEPFDFDGRYFHLKQAVSSPKPLQTPYPVLLNAGMSPAAVDLAAREVNFLFVNPENLDDAKVRVEGIRRRAAESGREVRFLTHVLIVCRETERDAEAWHREILAKADYEAGFNLARWVAGVSEEQAKQLAPKMIVGYGGYRIVGTPARVAGEIERMYRAGCEAILLTFIDYYQELAYFGEAVMPLLRQAGLRD